MQQEGDVVNVDAATGRFALRADDGSYVLAEQLGTRPMQAGDRLSGRMDVTGTETLAGIAAGQQYDVFIVAYGLSLDAVESALQA